VAKKKFSSGLDSIFEETVVNNAQVENSQMLESTAAIATDEPVLVPRRAKNKTFTSDLDSLFQEAMTESLEQKIGKKQRGIDASLSESGLRNYKKPLSGLDALIRQTSDKSLLDLEQAPVKRITFTFENAKIEKLKIIARREQSYVRDLVQEVIAGFIEDYEKQKGI
jgi:hypothetical protein